MRKIYLDHAAATPIDPRVLRLMQPYFSKKYANPSSGHGMGEEAREAVEQARAGVAKMLGARPEEIIFTSGGTESVNLALKGVAFLKKKGHIITSSVEHAAVLEPCTYLESMGLSVTYLPVNKYGVVDPQDVAKAIRKDTILISVMYVNNEVGAIQPIAEIGNIAHEHNILFHTDACQAGLLNLDVMALHVDLMTLNGSKVHGPKGIGILYHRLGVPLVPLQHGGGQESGLRSGTENVPGIIGFAKALELTQKEKRKESQRLKQVRDYFVQKVLQQIPQTTVLGPLQLSSPHIVNLAFWDVEAEVLMRHLSQKRIYVSVGSACHVQQIRISHVLQAMGISEKEGLGSIRFSFGKGTMKQEMDRVIRSLKKIVSALRKV